MQNNSFLPNLTLRVRREVIHFKRPLIMGILNITPDSFFANSRVATETQWISKAEQMLEEGATFLDLGGYSSRPGATDISEQEELRRVVPAVRSLCKKFPNAWISIDTFRARVAQESIDAGAVMVNDISGGWQQPEIIKVVARAQVPYICMHMKGTPQTMDRYTQYEHVMNDIITYFHERIRMLYDQGVTDVLIDPGFGFAKTTQQNNQIVRQLNELSLLECPVVVGLSRKSMIWKHLKIDPREALNGTTVLHTLALLKGVHVLRVHDVKEAMEAIKLVEVIMGSDPCI